MGKKILYIAEIVTKSAVYCVKKHLKTLKKEYDADFVIANADAASGGFGLGKNHSIYLRKLGIDVLTSGDLIYNKKDIQDHLMKAYYLLRPANFPQASPGRGWRTYSFGERSGKADRSNNIAVINLLGQAGFNRIHPSNPYSFLPIIVDRAKQDADIIILDFHAPISAEKAAMNLHADGRVSAVIGSGMRVQTSDARVLSAGTAVISDAGRTGSIQSVGGFDPKAEIRQKILGVPLLSSESWKGLEIQGVVLDIDDGGKANSIEAFRYPVESPESENRETAAGSS